MTKVVIKEGSIAVNKLEAWKAYKEALTAAKKAYKEAIAPAEL